MELPRTQYARTDSGSLAFQIVGDGPVDLLYMNGFCSHLDLNWASPSYAAFLHNLSTHARLIITDRRGYGLSERYAPSDVPTIESTTDDVVAVLDAAQSERAVFFPTSWSGFAGAFVAAAHPARISGLVLCGFSPTFTATEETPWGTSAASWDAFFEGALDEWATPAWVEPFSSYLDASELEWLVRWTGACIPPGAASHEIRHWRHLDVRSILPTIQVPTLVLADRDSDDDGGIRSSRYVAGLIPSASVAEYNGADQFHWYQGATGIVEEVGKFLSDVGDEQVAFGRTLATVLFTDIVDSTAQSAVLGDHAWREVRERHDQVVRSQLARFRGQEVNTMGDGFLATFDGPARAVKAAAAITEGVRPLGIEVRAGLHTGEVELAGKEVSGIAVAIGARVGAKAGPSEVLVSQTVKDLVIGSGLTFEDAGEHQLKGVPDTWRLYRVVA